MILMIIVLRLMLKITSLRNLERNKKIINLREYNKNMKALLVKNVLAVQLNLKMCIQGSKNKSKSKQKQIGYKEH